MQRTYSKLKLLPAPSILSFKLAIYIMLVPLLLALLATSVHCQESYEVNREELIKRLEYAAKLRVGIAHYQDLLKIIDQTKEQINWLDGCDSSNPITKQELEGNGQPLARINKLRAQLEEQIKTIETADYTDLSSEILFKLKKSWRPPDINISIQFQIDKCGKVGKFKWQRYSHYGQDNQALQNALSQIVLSKFSRLELPVECDFSSLGYDQMLAIGKPGASRKHKIAIMKTPCFKP